MAAESPPRLIFSFGLTTASGGIWAYSSSDPVATVTSPGYVTDARSIGMVRGDIVLHRQSTNLRLHLLAVDSIADSGAATLALSQILYIGDLAPEEQPTPTEE